MNDLSRSHRESARMLSTPLTLLERLRRNDDPDGWGRFVDLYSPLLFEWSRRNGVPESDAADLVQNVLVLLIKRIPQFERRPGGSFRGWLFTILRNCWRDQCRSQARQPAIAMGVSPDEQAGTDPIADLTEVEYRNYLFRRTLRVIQTDFPEPTWRAFWLHVVEGRPAAEVAKATGVTPNAVYLARGRVLKRLREELAGFLD
jgi:RNA polymerase sigma-70 factor (ECF subfamily)